MARPKTGPREWLKRLEKAEPKAREAGKGGRKLSAEPMSELLGVTWVTLRGLANDNPAFEDSGAFIRGGNGVEWEFKPIATVKWLQEHFAAVEKVRVDAARRQRKLVGGDGLEGLPEDATLKDIQEAIKTSAMIREEKLRSGKLVDAEQMGSALNSMMAKMQAAMVKSANRADPTNRWPAEIREAFDNAISEVGEQMVLAGEAELRRLSGGAS